MKNIPYKQSELDALRYICAKYDLKYYFLPTSKQGIIEITVKHSNGTPIRPEFAFALGRELQGRIEFDFYAASLPQTNNVVVLVEPIEDLP